MFSSNDKISNRQLKRMLIFDMFSVSFLIIPYIAVKSAGTGGIVVVLLGSILAFAYAGFMYFFMKQFNQEEIVVDARVVQGEGKFPEHEKQCETIKVSYIAYSKRTVGSILTGIFCILYLVKVFLLLAFCATLFTKVIGDTLLVSSNPKIILATLLIVAGYGGVQGIEKRARFTEVVYLLALIPIILYLILGIPRVDLANLAMGQITANKIGESFFMKNGNNYMWGSYLILLTYTVLESLLFVMPYVKNNTNKNKKLLHYIMQVVLIIGVLNLFIYIITVGILGVGETGQKFWSVVTVMQIIELPGGFIKRQDDIMLTFWLLSIYTVLSACLFYLVYITQEFLHLCILNHFPNRKSHGSNKKQAKRESLHESPVNVYLVIGYSILIYLFSISITNIEEEFINFGRYFAYIGIPQSILIPIILLVVSKIRQHNITSHKRRSSLHEESKI